MTAAQCLQHPWLSRHPIPDPNLVNTKDNIKECLERWSPEKQMPTLNTKKNLKQNSPPSSEKKLKLDITLKENASPNIEKRPKHDLTASPDIGGEKKIKLDVKTSDVLKQEVKTSTTIESKLPNITHQTSSNSLKPNPTSLSPMETSEISLEDRSPTIKNLELHKSEAKSTNTSKITNTNNLNINVKSIETTSDQSNIVPKSPSSSKITNSATLNEINTGKSTLETAKSIRKSPSPSKTNINALVKETETLGKSAELLRQNSSSPRQGNVIVNEVNTKHTEGSSEVNSDSKSLSFGKIENERAGIIKETIKQPEETPSEKKLKLHPPPTPEIESISDDQPKTDKKLKVHTPFTPETVVKSPLDTKESLKSNISSKTSNDIKIVSAAPENKSKLLEEKSQSKTNASVLENTFESPEVKVLTTGIQQKEDNIVLTKQEAETNGLNKVPLKDIDNKSLEIVDKLSLKPSLNQNEKKPSSALDTKLKQSNSKLSVSEERPKTLEDEKNKSINPTSSVKHLESDASHKPMKSNVLSNKEMANQNKPEKNISEKIQPYQSSLKVVIDSADSGSSTEQRRLSASKPPTPTSPKLSPVANKKNILGDIGLSKLKIDDKKTEQASSTSDVKIDSRTESKETNPDASFKTSTSKQLPLQKMASQSQLSNKGSSSSLSNTFISSIESSSSKLPSNPLNIPIISSDRTFQRGLSKSSTDVRNKFEKQTAIEQKSNQKESLNKTKDVKLKNDEILQKISELTEKANKTSTNDSLVQRKLSITRQLSSDKKEPSQQISSEKKEESKEKVITIKSNNSVTKNKDSNNFAEVKYTQSTNNANVNTSKNTFKQERKTSKDNIVSTVINKEKSKHKETDSKEGGPSQMNIPKIITHKIHIESDSSTAECTSSDAARRGSLENTKNKQRLNLLDEFRQDRRASDISCFFTGEDDYITEEINRLSDRLKDLKSSSFDNSTSSESLFQRIRRPKYKISHFSRDVPVNSPPPSSNMTYYMRHSQSPGSQSPTNDVLINFLTQFNDQTDAKANIDVHKKETTAPAV